MRKFTSDTKIMQDFSARFLRLSRDNDQGLSNAEIGKLFAVSSTTVFKWKNAQSMPKIANACLIAIRYKVNVHWLLTGEDGPDGEMEVHSIMEALSPGNQERVLESARAFQALEKLKS